VHFAAEIAVLSSTGTDTKPAARIARKENVLTSRHLKPGAKFDSWPPMRSAFSLAGYAST
jgi:hypothetical protein